MNDSSVMSANDTSSPKGMFLCFRC